MNKTIEMILNEVKEPNEAFDLICLHNFMMWQMDWKRPVDDNIKVFEHIKQLILDDLPEFTI